MRSSTVHRAINASHPARLWPLLSTILLLLLVGCSRPKGQVTLAFLGDINLARQVHASAESFAPLQRSLGQADLALANLESPLGEAPAAQPGQYSLCASTGNTELLADWGLDLLAFANNHTRDCGPDGAAQTLAAVQAAGLDLIQLDSLPLYRQVNGLTLAFLAFDDISSPVDERAALASIRSAAETGALMIVSVHWGMEYQEGISPRQQGLARQFAEAGAAVIWGHHPHVLQPVEWFEIGGRKTLVLYSLGNALFDQGGLEDTRQSALMTITLTAKGPQSIKATPFVIDVQNSRVEKASAAQAKVILERLKIK